MTKQGIMNRCESMVAKEENARRYEDEIAGLDRKRTREKPDVLTEDFRALERRVSRIEKSEVNNRPKLDINPGSVFAVDWGKYMDPPFFLEKAAPSPIAPDATAFIVMFEGEVDIHDSYPTLKEAQEAADDMARECDPSDICVYKKVSTVAVKPTELVRK